MVEITTCHISQMDKHHNEDTLVVDVTAKSAKGNAKALAPEWKNVRAYLDGKMSKEEYTTAYLKKIHANQKNFPKRWENTLRNYKKLVFACYCKPGDFCHRILLAAEFKAYAKKIGIEASIVPETPTITTPTKQPKTGDGVDHINIYSKGQTDLGRWLSNFQRSPLTIDDVKFMSIEGYWYWLLTDCEPEKKDVLRGLTNFKAKQTGKTLCKQYGRKLMDTEFREKIKKALRLKVENKPSMIEALKVSTLPFRHYYVYGGKEVNAGFEWLVEEWETIRSELKGEVPDRVLYHGHEGRQVLEEDRYAGVGSRKTPERVLKLMNQYGTMLAEKGFILRSGEADGADSAFEEGCDATKGQKEIFRSGDATNWSKQLVQKYLPAGYKWERMRPYIQGLLARNMMQMLGHDGDKPVKFVLCWTEDGKDSGGTGYIIRAARDHGIPVYNLRNISEHSEFRKKILGL